MSRRRFALPREAGGAAAHAPAIIFVHGLAGAPDQTWSSMLTCFAGDSVFDGYALDCYSYPTMLLRLPFTAPAPGLRSIADGLRTFLDEQHSERRDIILVGHSLGGVVARQFVVSELRAHRPLRVRGLALVGAPNNGSMLASVGRLISFPHRQLKRLSRDDEGLMGINIDWEQLQVEDQLPVRYVVGGCDKAVPHNSAVPHPERDNKSLIIDADHGSLIRPKNTDDIRYRTLRRFILQLGVGTSASTVPGASVRRGPDPLFDAYTINDEPYYVARTIDRLIADALGSGHVWLVGCSGVGKSAVLRRAVLKSGWQLNHISLGGYDVDGAAGLFRALAHELAAIAGIDRRIGIGDDFATSCSFVKDVLRSFPSDLTIGNVIEELPVGDATLTEFADLIGQFLESLSTDAVLFSRVVFAFSSLEPLGDVRAKTREKLQILHVGSWSPTEALQLTSLLATTLRPALLEEDRDQIVNRANGSPRFIKQLFRMWRNHTDNGRALPDLLAMVASEQAR